MSAENVRGEGFTGFVADWDISHIYYSQRSAAERLRLHRHCGVIKEIRMAGAEPTNCSAVEKD